MKEKAPKRKLPFTVGANGDQKDSDSGEACGGGGASSSDSPMLQEEAVHAGR